MPKPELKGRKTNKINYEGLYKSFQESCSNFNAYRMIKCFLELFKRPLNNVNEGLFKKFQECCNNLFFLIQKRIMECFLEFSKCPFN